MPDTPAKKIDHVVLDVPGVRSDDVRALITDLEGRGSDNDALSVEVDTYHRGGEFRIVDSEGFPLFTLSLVGDPTPDEAAIEADEHEYQGPGE